MCSAAYLVFSLIFPEEDVEGSCKAPHGEHQEQQGPLHIIQDGLQSVHKGVLGWLKHPAAHKSAAIHHHQSLHHTRHAESLNVPGQLCTWAAQVVGRLYNKYSIKVWQTADRLDSVYAQHQR